MSAIVLTILMLALAQSQAPTRIVDPTNPTHAERRA
jgi:hypothetical protein